jgi:hypothetical protein
MNTDKVKGENGERGKQGSTTGETNFPIWVFSVFLWGDFDWEFVTGLARGAGWRAGARARR